MFRIKSLTDVARNFLMVLLVAVLCAKLALAQGNFKLLYSWGGPSCNKLGCGSVAPLIFDSKGNLYGQTGGGDGVNATIFRLAPVARGRWAYRTLYVLNLNQGSTLDAGLTFDSSGNLYGTSQNGGAHDSGSVFRLSPSAAVSGGWSLQVLYSFYLNGRDLASPWDSVILDKDGNVYGTTRDGGPYQGGGVFQLMQGPGGVWKENILHAFPANKDDGVSPYVELTWDAQGNLYGTCSAGGPGYFYGDVFELGRTGSGWKEKLLHPFKGLDGYSPMGGLIFDSKGNLFGTTYNGGTSKKCKGVPYGCGTVFKLTPQADGKWKETVLWDFPDPNNGGGPASTLVMDKAGNLYGTAAGGGLGQCGGFGCGVVYKLAPTSQGKWKYAVLHRFSDAKDDGAQPNAALIFDKQQKHLYSTTAFGGTDNMGTIFEITLSQ
jgi:uncharacterized repeat protein (TIGR03803 family)